MWPQVLPYLRRCTYHNSSRHFFHYLHTYPLSCLRETPTSALCHAYTVFNLFSTVYSYLLLPSALSVPFFPHGWRSFCWWAEYLLHAKFPLSSSEGSLLNRGSLDNIKRWFLSGIWTDRISWGRLGDVSITCNDRLEVISRRGPWSRMWHRNSAGSYDTWL